MNENNQSYELIEKSKMDVIKNRFYEMEGHFVNAKLILEEEDEIKYTQIDLLKELSEIENRVEYLRSFVKYS